MARTLSKALATTTRGARHGRQLPVGVRSVVGTVRTMTVSGYRVVSAVRGVAARAIFVGAALLADRDRVGGAVVGVARVLGTRHRGRRRLRGHLRDLAAERTAVRRDRRLHGHRRDRSLAIKPERRWLFGTKPTDGGWVGRNVHWLSGSWWRPLIVVLAIIVAITLDAIVVSAVRRWLLRKVR